ncbi:MAG: hypothetical protein IPJ77_09930 [Planctomycetes bacterium]|nr:hypothetical protein [Planctomycetota bacterium]
MKHIVLAVACVAGALSCSRPLGVLRLSFAPAPVVGTDLRVTADVIKLGNEPARGARLVVSGKGMTVVRPFEEVSSGVFEGVVRFDQAGRHVIETRVFFNSGDNSYLQSHDVDVR